MTTWRFYAQRAVSGEWLDNDVQLTPQCAITYGLSAFNTCQIELATPGVEPFGSDGRPVWGRWDTLLYVEKDGALDSVYLADSVTPGPGGTQVSLIGAAAWLNRVDYSGTYQVWETNTFDVIRHLIDHANAKPRGLTFTYPPSLMSATTVGSPNPPAKPHKPGRHKHETKSAYHASARYTAWQTAITAWNTAYSGAEKFKILFWESPYVGDEIISLASSTGFDWRESYRWSTPGQPGVPEFKINFADDLSATRTDIVIEDGINVQGRLQTTDDDQTYANHVLGVGAGQGRKTRKVTSNYDDGRLYSTRYLIRKHVHHKQKLQRLADRAVKRYRVLDPQIGTVTVFDTAGYKAVESIKPGDIIPVRSNLVTPHINTMAKVTSKTVYPFNPGAAQITFETQSS